MQFDIKQDKKIIVERMRHTFRKQLPELSECIERSKNGLLLSDKQIQVAKSNRLGQPKVKKNAKQPYSVVFDENDTPYAIYSHALGEGGFGKVKVAQNLNTGEWVAIKVVNLKREFEPVMLGFIERRIYANATLISEPEKWNKYLDSIFSEILKDGAELESMKQLITEQLKRLDEIPEDLPADEYGIMVDETLDDINVFLLEQLLAQVSHAKYLIWYEGLPEEQKTNPDSHAFFDALFLAHKEHELTQKAGIELGSLKRGLKDYSIQKMAGLQNLEKYQLENGRDLLSILESANHKLFLLHAARDILHRDLKPENIIVDPTNKKAELIDFGLSEFKGENNEDLVGSYLWMAPEATFQSDPPVYSEKSDVFMMGKINLFMIRELYKNDPNDPLFESDPSLKTLVDDSRMDMFFRQDVTALMPKKQRQRVADRIIGKYPSIMTDAGVLTKEELLTSLCPNNFPILLESLEEEDCRLILSGVSEEYVDDVFEGSYQQCLKTSLGYGDAEHEIRDLYAWFSMTGLELWEEGGILAVQDNDSDFVKMLKTSMAESPEHRPDASMQAQALKQKNESLELEHPTSKELQNEAINVARAVSALFQTKPARKPKEVILQRGTSDVKSSDLDRPTTIPVESYKPKTKIETPKAELKPAKKAGRRKQEFFKAAKEMGESFVSLAKDLKKPNTKSKANKAVHKKATSTKSTTPSKKKGKLRGLISKFEGYIQTAKVHRQESKKQKQAEKASKKDRDHKPK